MMTKKDKMEEYFIIEKHERSWHSGLLFWKPKSLGYTDDVTEAGLYNKRHAMDITKNNTHEDKFAILKEVLYKLCKPTTIIDIGNMTTLHDNKQRSK